MFAARAAFLTSRPGVISGSVSLDGSGDYLSAPNNSAFSLSGQFTVECFVKFTAYSARNNWLVSHMTAGEQGWLIRYTGTNLRWYGVGDGSVIDRAWTAATDTWYHLAVSRDSSNNMRLFIDGSLQGSATSNSSNYSQSTTPLYIGGHPNFATDTSGFISNVRIIKGSCEYTTSFTKPSAPLTAVTNTSILTCQSPTTFTDASTNNFTITAHGNAVASSQSPFA